MNSTGTIRELSEQNTLLLNEIDVTNNVKDLEKLCKKARKEYYRAIKQNLSEEAALACALGIQRQINFSKREI